MGTNLILFIRKTLWCPVLSNLTWFKTNDENEFFKYNQEFALNYVDEFIKTTLENEIIPDILILVFNELSKFDKKNDLISIRYI